MILEVYLDCLVVPNPIDMLAHIDVGLSMTSHQQ